MPYHLKIITSTVRPGRKGPLIADWVAGLARGYGSFEVEVLELGAINLPMMNEPHHPKLQRYEHEHTRWWSARIAQADAFIFVTTEYNHSIPAPLKNALDYLVVEWGYKPVGFVSYAGISGGTRATNALKDVVTPLKMMPLFEAVHIPFYTRYIDEAAQMFRPEDTQVQAAQAMLRELERWAEALRGLRLPGAQPEH
jgi:NAD(P)H-dependent FMN reductase